jgi:hypothetical protein
MSAKLSRLGRTLLAELLDSATVVEPAGDTFRGHLIDSATFAETDYRMSWLVPNVMVQGQPAIVGGPKKGLKTSIVVDLVVSIASGTSFLGYFTPGPMKRVAIFSGETGQATLKETTRRICAVKRIDLTKLRVFWGFELPQLSKADDLRTLGETIGRQRIEVVVIDPLYLCLLAGTTNLQASNLYQMGPLFKDAAQVCLRAGATPILVHHHKMNQGKPEDPPELEDLAYAGVQEFARQWLLVGRRQKYEPGTGEHRLWLVSGGSSGFSGCWAVDVQEGVIDSDFAGRRWLVHVRTMAEERQLKQTEQQKNRQGKGRRKREKIVTALGRYLAGETCNVLAESAGVSNGVARKILDELVDEGMVLRRRVAKAGRLLDGYRIKPAMVPHDDDDDDQDERDGDQEMETTDATNNNQDCADDDDDDSAQGE